MTLGTWLALRDDPALLGRDDTLPGAVARALAADAARDRPDSITWRCVVIDGEHGTVLGVGRPLSTPHHDPPGRLADLVRTIHPTCVFPGCAVPANRCDLDHRHPYERGGSTCSCNLHPLCRTHHRLKGSGRVTVRPAGPLDPQPAPEQARAPGDEGGHEELHDKARDHHDGLDEELEAFLHDLDRRHSPPALPAGSLVWQLRSGKAYVRVPPPPTPAPLTTSMHGIPAHLDTHRRAEAAELRRLNHDLADAVDRDRRRRAAAHRESERQSELAALHEERVWAPADDHERSMSESTVPAVPDDLARLWADAPLPTEPDRV